MFKCIKHCFNISNEKNFTFDIVKFNTALKKFQQLATLSSFFIVQITKQLTPYNSTMSPYIAYF
jgi:hypothetical protein